MGAKVFENSKIKVHYKILNIEEDVVSQGFIPGHYDIIIANLVIHATKSISQTSRNLRNLLREHGTLIISECVAPGRGTNLTFGLLDAYWHYAEGDDFMLRGYNCEISQEKWLSVLTGAGYCEAVSYPAYGDSFALITARNVTREHISYHVPRAVEAAKKEKAWWVFSEDGKFAICKCAFNVHCKLIVYIFICTFKVHCPPMSSRTWLLLETR